MDLPMYEDMRKLIMTPYTHYVTQLQALVNNKWENSTQTNFNVWQEAPFGSKEFVPVEVSIDTSIDIGTGFKKGDDFKIFSHRDISHQVPLGTMFKTDTDYWICINTNGYASPTNSCEVRRCNNIMRWINPENGYVYQQWCVIDYELSAPQPLKDKQIVTANGHIFLIVQGNELTRSLRKNQRFIFNGQPYKITGFQTLLDDVDNEQYSDLLYMDLYLDMEKPTDDLVGMVADAGDYVYTIEIDPDFVKQVSGFTGQMSASVYLNGNAVDRDIEWSGSDNVEINEDGVYTLIGEAGETAYVKANIKGNPDYIVSQPIEIVEVIDDDYAIVIEPLITEARLEQPRTFSVYLYKNGVQQDDDVFVEASGVDESYYSLIMSSPDVLMTNNNIDIMTNSKQDIEVVEEQDDGIDNNGHIFTLTALKMSLVPLRLRFTSRDIARVIDIYLRPYF